MKQYIFNLLIGLDQLINALAGGDPMETISYRAAIAELQNRKWACFLCKVLGLVQKDHCEITRQSTDKAVILWHRSIEGGLE